MANNHIPYSKAARLIVRQLPQSEDGKYRYIVTGTIISDVPLKNIPSYEMEDVVLESVDLEDGIYQGKTIPLIRSLEQLDTRKSNSESAEPAQVAHVLEA